MIGIGITSSALHVPLAAAVLHQPRLRTHVSSSRKAGFSIVDWQRRLASSYRGRRASEGTSNRPAAHDGGCWHSRLRTTYWLWFWPCFLVSRCYSFSKVACRRPPLCQRHNPTRLLFSSSRSADMSFVLPTLAKTVSV